MSSVTGFSHLEYVFAAAQVLRNKPNGSATVDEVKKAIDHVANIRLHQWLIKVGRRESRVPQKIKDDCLEAMRKWGLIKKEGERIIATEEILLMGELLNKNQEKDARRILLNAMLRSNKERPFHPSSILLNIRNSGPSHKIKMAFSKIKTEFSPEIPFFTESGMALDDVGFVKDKLKTNFRAFDIMCDWGTFFELLDYKSIDQGTMKNLLKKHAPPGYLDELSKRYNLRNINIERPKRIVYLTVRIASLSELIFAHVNGLNKLNNLNDFAKRCIREILSELDFKSGEEISVEKIFERSLEKGIILISDGPRVYGIISKGDLQLIDTEKTYALMLPRVSIDEFRRNIEKIHSMLSGGRPIIPVWVGDLAELTCAELRIPESLFKELLLKLKLMGAVAFYKAPMFIAGEKRRRRLPIIDETGRSYHQVSLR